MPVVILNYWAVLAAGVAGMVVGMLWYSPLLFGKVWARLMGVSSADREAAKKKGMGGSYAIAFVAQVVMAWVLGWIISAIGVTGFTAGLQAGFWTWLGFVATVLVGGVLWEKKSWNLYILNAAYWLVNLLVTGVVLVSWV